MTDKMEPVAWQPRYKDDVIEHHRSIGSGLQEYAMTVFSSLTEAEGYGYGGHEVRSLYTADQVKELEDRIGVLEHALEQVNGPLSIAALEARATTAEAALAEASKVIKPFALLRDDLADDEIIALHVENFDAARAWLQANKGEK